MRSRVKNPASLETAWFRLLSLFCSRKEVQLVLASFSPAGFVCLEREGDRRHHEAHRQATRQEISWADLWMG